MSRIATDKPLPSERTARRQAAWSWWTRLTDERMGDRGALARLRRAHAPVEAWTEPETMRLYAALGFDARHRSTQGEAVAILAIVLAGVRENRAESLGKALGGDPPVLHPLRMRRLTAARDGAEVLRGFREAVSLLGGAASVGDLATCILGWLDPDARDATRTQFLFDHYGAGSFAPPSSDSNETNDTELTS